MPYLRPGTVVKPVKEGNHACDGQDQPTDWATGSAVLGERRIRSASRRLRSALHARIHENAVNTCADHIAHTYALHIDGCTHPNAKGHGYRFTRTPVQIYSSSNQRQTQNTISHTHGKQGPQTDKHRKKGNGHNKTKTTKTGRDRHGRTGTDRDGQGRMCKQPYHTDSHGLLPGR
jgi:hypothetical protein